MRLWFRIILIGLGLLALAVAALPYWLGWVLPAVGRRAHLSFRGYEHRGYSQMVLHDAVYQFKTVRVSVRTVQIDTPVLWAWRHLHHGDRAARADGWAVVVTRSTTPPSGRPVGMQPLHALLLKIAARLNQWLPSADLGAGTVNWPQGGFSVQSAQWRKGTLDLTGLHWRAGSVSGRIVFAAEGRVHVDAQEPDRAWKAEVVWDGPTVTGQGWAWDQPLSISGRYAAQGWLPTHAEAVAANWTVSAPEAGLGAQYGNLTGGGRASWDNGSYSLAVQASAAPQAKHLPPARIDVRAGGDRHEWRIDALDIQLPYGKVHLSQPLAFRYGTRPALAGARLDLAADLAASPIAGAQGSVSGQVTLSGAAGMLPSASFSLRARGVGWRDFPVADLVAQGSCDFQQRTISNVTVSTQWARMGREPWLPPKLTVKGVELAVHADGPWTAVRHTGELKASEVDLPGLLPATVDLTWKGTQENIEAVTAKATIGELPIELQGAVAPGQVTVNVLRLAPPALPALALVHPVTVAWSPALAVGPIELKGDSTDIAVEWDRAGASSLRVANLRSDWIETVLSRWTPPDFNARSLRFSDHWEKGQLVFNLQMAASIGSGEGTAQVAVRADSDGRDVKISQCEIQAEGGVLARAEGQLPLAISREGGMHVELDANAPLLVRAGTDANSPFWPAVAQALHLTLDHPEASLTAEGTLEAPRGLFHLGIARLATAPGVAATWKVPALDNLVVDAHADTSAIVLDRLAGSIAGQPITGSGRAPMGRDSWLGLVRHKGRLDWSRAQGHVEIAEARLEPLASFLPPMIAPRGRWSAHADFAHGTLTGTLHLERLALRPISPLGVVQNITGDVTWSGKSLQLSGLRAEIGGRTVTVAGRVALPGPEVALTIQGQAIPLVRQANLLVRADLDLKALTEQGEPRLEGTVKVTDGLMLGDLADLLPNGMSGGARPPPYFSIETPPFSRWRLDVQIAAAHTLRISTPLFSGKASVQFQLTGTLADPRAIGVLRVDSGSISLPFANFDVQVGAVRLTADDPFHPKIDLQAVSQRNDYNIRMIASGPADSPVLSFTSNPALPSDQILALVMAGQAPTIGNLAGGTQTQSQVAGIGEYLGEGIISGFSGGGGASRLSITTGAQVSQSGKPTYEIEYRLAPRWWIVGEYDQFDDQNAGIKWRVLSKGGGP